MNSIRPTFIYPIFHVASFKTKLYDTGPRSTEFKFIKALGEGFAHLPPEAPKPTRGARELQQFILTAFYIKHSLTSFNNN